MFAIDPKIYERSLYDVMTGQSELADALLKDVTPGVDLLPGDERIDDRR